MRFKVGDIVRICDAKFLERRPDCIGKTYEIKKIDNEYGFIQIWVMFDGRLKYAVEEFFDLSFTEYLKKFLIEKGEKYV